MKNLLSFFLVLGMASVATATGSQNVKSSVIEFEKGITNLTQDQKDELRNLVRSSEFQNKELDIGIAAWADEPFPGERKELSDTQRKIANQRIESIREAINSLKIDVDDYSTYSMAEGSNWLARLFNTESSELKSMFSKKDQNSSLMKEKYRLYRDKGDTSKAVVVVNLDD